jgi:hypothetical protein
LAPTLRIELPGNGRHDSLPGQSKARQKLLDRWGKAENLNVFPRFSQICVRHLPKRVVLSAHTSKDV